MPIPWQIGTYHRQHGLYGLQCAHRKANFFGVPTECNCKDIFIQPLSCNIFVSIVQDTKSTVMMRMIETKMASVTRCGYHEYRRGILLKAPLIQHLANIVNLNQSHTISLLSLQIWIPFWAIIWHLRNFTELLINPSTYYSNNFLDFAIPWDLEGLGEKKEVVTVTWYTFCQ